jgi:PrcB C-terminal
LLPSFVRSWIDAQKKRSGVFTLRWDRTRFALISLGLRPNPGYRLELVKTEESEREVAVFVAERLPLPGRVYPQVIVYPHILAEIKAKLHVWLVRPDGTLVPF